MYRNEQRRCPTHHYSNERYYEDGGAGHSTREEKQAQLSGLPYNVEFEMRRRMNRGAEEHQDERYALTADHSSNHSGHRFSVPAGLTRSNVIDDYYHPQQHPSSEYPEKSVSDSEYYRPYSNRPQRFEFNSGDTQQNYEWRFNSGQNRVEEREFQFNSGNNQRNNGRQFNSRQPRGQGNAFQFNSSNNQCNNRRQFNSEPRNSFNSSGSWQEGTSECRRLEQPDETGPEINPHQFMNTLSISSSTRKFDMPSEMDQPRAGGFAFQFNSDNTQHNNGRQFNSEPRTFNSAGSWQEGTSERKKLEEANETEPEVNPHKFAETVCYSTSKRNIREPLRNNCASLAETIHYWNKLPRPTEDDVSRRKVTFGPDHVFQERDQFDQAPSPFQSGQPSRPCIETSDPPVKTFRPFSRQQSYQSSSGSSRHPLQPFRQYDSRRSTVHHSRRAYNFYARWPRVNRESHYGDMEYLNVYGFPRYGDDETAYGASFTLYDDDVKNVGIAGQEMTLSAVFRLLYLRVGEYNSPNGRGPEFNLRQPVALLHPLCLDKLIIHDEPVDALVWATACFHQNKDNVRRFLLPIQQKREVEIFFLVEFGMLRGKVMCSVYDSSDCGLFLPWQAETLAKVLFPDQPFGNIEKVEVYREKKGFNDSGVFTILNAELCLESHEFTPDVERFKRTRNGFFDTTHVREELEKELYDMFLQQVILLSINTAELEKKYR